ncbi:uncharacterized protein LOC141608334 [Silene latifolia]|uniref:uncharacterized protein LOC141608334 n=1 Tax=Silene latifolia TaxID=37657 RepID=UPI003D788D81
MADFATASAYCQRFKTLSDQLKNIGSPISNTRLVLHMVLGLTPTYHGVGTIIRQNDHLPPLYRACSILDLEEAGFAKHSATNGSGSAMYSAKHDNEAYPSILGRPRVVHGKGNNKGGGKKKKGGGNKKGKGNNKRVQTIAATTPTTHFTNAPFLA